MTKAMPKEMLPIVDKPAIQYVVEEAVNAGVKDVLMVTGRNKYALENHFDRHLELETTLTAKGDSGKLAIIQETADLANIHYMRQGEAKGLGHAVLCAKYHVGNEPFVVLLGDDLIDEAHDVLPEMIDIRTRYGGSVVALMEVPREDVYKYGCAAVTETGETDIVTVNNLVEKPEPGTEPSNLVVIGRYLLDPSVFGILETQAPGRGGEIQLTDALETLAQRPREEGGGVHAVIFRGARYDTGDKLSYLQAVVQVASQRADLGADFNAWLTDFVNKKA
jgi:UTP--glucose-1-phosphate uridylyltransferase